MQILSQKPKTLGGTAIWVSETIVDIIECTYSISHSIPLLELCSRNKFDIDMRV